jgi:hypothetical protein
MALIGNNGDNEANVAFSKSISYSIYDESMTEIPVNNLNKKIEYWIPKDKAAPIQPYKFINAVNISGLVGFDNLNKTNNSIPYIFSNGSIYNGFKLTGTNVSIHIQIQPINKVSIGYLFLLKCGDNPLLN